MSFLKVSRRNLRYNLSQKHELWSTTADDDSDFATVHAALRHAWQHVTKEHRQSCSSTEKAVKCVREDETSEL